MWWNLVLHSLVKIMRYRFLHFVVGKETVKDTWKEEGSRYMRRGFSSSVVSKRHERANGFTCSVCQENIYYAFEIIYLKRYTWNWCHEKKIIPGVTKNVFRLSRKMLLKLQETCCPRIFETGLKTETTATFLGLFSLLQGIIFTPPFILLARDFSECKAHLRPSTLACKKKGPPKEGNNFPPII